MTCQELYKGHLINHVTNYLDTETRKLNPFKSMGRFEILSLGSKIKHCNEAIQKYEELKTVEPHPFMVDLMNNIEEEFILPTNNYRERLRILKEEESQAVNRLDIEKRNVIKDKENELERWLVERRKSLQLLINKHKRIIDSKPELDKLFHTYKINASEVTVDYESITMAELEELIDIASTACDVTISNKKISEKITSIFYLPAIKGFSDTEQDKVFKAVYFAILIILGLFLKPYFLSVVSLGYFISMFGNLYKVYEKEDLLKLAYALTSSLDFESVIKQNKEYDDLLLELDSLRIYDNTKEKLKVSESFKPRYLELSKENPELLLNEERECYARNLDNIKKQFDDAYSTAHRNWANLCTSYLIDIDSMRKYFNELKENSKFLGSDISESRVLSLSMKLGVGKFDGEIVSEASAELPLKNILFSYKNEDEKLAQIDFMKLLLCNMLCNIKEKYLSVVIYDYKDLGRDFAEFYRSEISEYVSAVHSDFKKLLEKSVNESKKNMVLFGRNTIQHFNREAESVGKVTKDYKLIIILSTEEELYQNKMFKSFFEYSAELGTIVWLLGKDESTLEEKKAKKVREFYSGMVRSDTYGQILADGVYIGGYDYPIEAYMYNPKLGSMSINTLVRAIEENRVDILPYEEGFREKYIPDDKIWTFSTNKGIEFHFGLLDGDPLMGLPVVVGDDAVHGLMAGATGSGKSATLNNIIANLLHMYSPEELELVMVDFKNVEFVMYTGESQIPHAKIIAGTKDGEYALSIFDYLIDETKRRTKLYSELKLQKNEDYNNHMIRTGHPEKCLPRILCIFDEFQVMFTEVDDRALDKIKSRIVTLSKVARFCAIHLFFTSQSMSGTMSADILDQFKLRAALGCSSDTSMQLIGNPAASIEIKSKGFIITNLGANDAKNNKMWRIPFIDNNYIKHYLKKLRAKCTDEGHINRDAPFYDESRVHSGTELTEFYDNNPHLKNDSTLFIMGERTSFSENRVPNNFKLLRDDGEHIFVTAFERQSMLNMANTFIENIKQHSSAILIITACDRDSVTLLNLEERVDEKFKCMLDTTLTAVDHLETLEHLIEHRSTNIELIYNPIYYLGLYWDKLSGLGRDEDYRNRVRERFTAVLQKASILNIHLIIFAKDTKEFRGLKNLFSYRIASFSAEMDSLNILDSSKATKISNDFALFQFGSIEWKFKIYNFPLYGKLEDREIKLMRD